MKSPITYLLMLMLAFVGSSAIEKPLTLVDLKLEQAGILAGYRDNHPLAQEIGAKIQTYEEIYPDQTLQNNLSLANKRYTKLKVEQASLSSKYREKHPLRVKTKKQIEFLEGSFEIQYDEGLLRSILPEKEAVRGQLGMKFRSSHPEVIAIDRAIQFIEKTLEEIANDIPEPRN
ncbi:MAG: hypothetical protein AAGH40_13935 [Verrucomicrobiota bacterium]